MSITTATPHVTAERKWTHLDTCDACGQYAKIEVATPSGPLLFCRHHEIKYGPVFDEKGWAVIDNPDWSV